MREAVVDFDLVWKGHAVREQTIYSLCKLGQIPAAKVGNQLRVLKQSLMDLLSSKPRRGHPPPRPPPSPASLWY